jgi:hypothetical protein
LLAVIVVDLVVAAVGLTVVVSHQSLALVLLLLLQSLLQSWCHVQLLLQAWIAQPPPQHRTVQQQQ